MIEALILLVDPVSNRDEFFRIVKAVIGRAKAAGVQYNQYDGKDYREAHISIRFRDLENKNEINSFLEGLGIKHRWQPYTEKRKYVIQASEKMSQIVISSFETLPKNKNFTRYLFHQLADNLFLTHDEEIKVYEYLIKRVKKVTRVK